MIMDSQMVVFVQPIKNMSMGIQGFETLLRTNTSEGINSAEQLVLECERDGTIQNLDVMVMEKLLGVLCTIGLPGEFITINVSAITMSDRAAVRELIKLGRKATGFDKRVCFEITETARGNVDNIIISSEDIIDNKMGVILDDYGSGYNCFGLLGNIEEL